MKANRDNQRAAEPGSKSVELVRWSNTARPGTDFLTRMVAIDALLAPYGIIYGTGSWIEAHLVSRLGYLKGIPNLVGCGITEKEIIDLCQRAQGQILTVFSTSIAKDQGHALCKQLKTLSNKPLICCVIDDTNHQSINQKIDCDAIVIASSFGSGAMHAALVAISEGRTYLDPMLTTKLTTNQIIKLKPREQQVLEQLAQGLSNKEIGSVLNISAVTVRDYVQSLCRKFAALNRTDVVFKATCSGYLP